MQTFIGILQLSVTIIV